MDRHVIRLRRHPADVVFRVREGLLLDVLLRTIGPAIRSVADPGTLVQIPVLVRNIVPAHGPIESRIDRGGHPRICRVDVPRGAVHRQGKARGVHLVRVDQIVRRLIEAAAREVVRFRVGEVQPLAEVRVLTVRLAVPY